MWGIEKCWKTWRRTERWRRGDENKGGGGWRGGERQRRGDMMLWVWEVGKFQGWITGALQADSVWGGRVCLDKTAWQLHCRCPALGWLISKAEFDAGGRGVGMKWHLCWFSVSAYIHVYNCLYLADSWWDGKIRMLTAKKITKQAEQERKHLPHQVR